MQHAVWNPLKDTHGWSYCNSIKKLQSFRQEYHWQSSQCNWYPCNPMGCSRNHCKTVSYSLLQWYKCMFFEDFGLKTWKSNNNMPRLYAGHKQHVPMHNIQSVLNSGPRGNWRCHAEGWCRWPNLNICFWSCYEFWSIWE